MNIVMALNTDHIERFFVGGDVHIGKDKTKIIVWNSQAPLLSEWDNDDIIFIRPTRQTYEEYYARHERDIREGAFPKPHKIGGPGYLVRWLPEGDTIAG